MATQKVLAHAIANQPYKTSKNITDIPMHVETQEGEVRIEYVSFPTPDIPTVEKYFASPEGINPIEVEI